MVEQSASPESSRPSDPLATLQSQLASVVGGPVRNIRRLSGGASRETWAFERLHDEDWEPLILRRDPPYTKAGPGRTGGMPLEARLFEAAQSAGVIVPKILASGGENDERLGSGFLIMTMVEGETIARKILRDEPYAHARTVLVRQLGEALGRLHCVPIDSIDGLEETNPLKKYRETLDVLDYPSPTFELAFRWLEQNRPRHSRQTVVHGDFRLGNIIVDVHGLAAVLDWELAHIGDPMEDLGWLSVRAWRFGGQGIVAGLSSLEELFDGYRSVGGVVDEEAVNWWIVAGTLIWGIMCCSQASAHTSGVVQSVELAAIGRRVAEQEHDLLGLLGAPPSDQNLVEDARMNVAPPLPNPLQAPNVRDSTSEIGVPDAATLLRAVRDFVDSDVFSATTGRVQFHARVASNVLATVERELRFGDAARTVLTQTASQFGATDERSLAQKIRSGQLAGQEEDLLASLRKCVDYRLAIANPKHFSDR